MSLRTVKTAEIVNRRACFAYFQNDPAVVDVLQRLANAAVRAGDLTEDQAIMAGINIKIEKV